MNIIEQLQEERVRIVHQMLDIPYARKGSVSEQYFPVLKDGNPTGKKRGPYWIFTAKVKNKTVSRRLKTQADVAHAHQEIGNHKLLQQLYHRFEELTERMGTLAQQAGPSEEGLKKGLKSRWKKTGKSRASSK